MILRDVLKCWCMDNGVPSVIHSSIEVTLMLSADNLASLYPVMSIVTLSLVAPPLPHPSLWDQYIAQEVKHSWVNVMEHQLNLLLQAAVAIVPMMSVSGVMVRGVTTYDVTLQDHMCYRN